MFMNLVSILLSKEPFSWSHSQCMFLQLNIYWDLQILQVKWCVWPLTALAVENSANLLNCVNASDQCIMHFYHMVAIHVKCLSSLMYFVRACVKLKMHVTHLRFEDLKFQSICLLMSLKARHICHCVLKQTVMIAWTSFSWLVLIFYMLLNDKILIKFWQKLKMYNLWNCEYLIHEWPFKNSKHQNGNAKTIQHDELLDCECVNIMAVKLTY